MPLVRAIIASSIYGEITITYINWWVIANTWVVWVVINSEDDLHKRFNVGTRNGFVTIHIRSGLVIFTSLIKKDIHQSR